MEYLIWQCKKMHPTWATSLNSVKNHNSWCPTCNQSKGELIITEILGDFAEPQYYASKIHNSFVGKIRYDFFVSFTGWLIEFDGMQHFIDVPYFTKTASLEHRQDLDRS